MITPTPHPLLFVRDPEVLDDLLRLATAAGVEAEVVPDVVAARRSWLRAPLVIMDMDAIAEWKTTSPGARPPRTARLILVALTNDDRRTEDGSDVWEFAGQIDADNVVFLPAAKDWLVEQLTQASSSARAHVVGVIGGRGGAGASVLAAALAVTAARAEVRTVLIDADPLAGGLELVLGHEDLGQNPQSDSPVVPAQAMRLAVDTAIVENDLVVIDLPRRLDEVAITALTRADIALLVVPVELRAIFAAQRVASIVQPHCDRVECVVRGPGPAQLDKNDIAAALELPLAGEFRSEPGLALALENGAAPAVSGRGPLARFSRRLLRRWGLLATPVGSAGLRDARRAA